MNLRVTDPNGLAKIVAQLRQRWSSLSGDPINQQEPNGTDRAGLLAEASLLTAQIHRQYTLWIEPGVRIEKGQKTAEEQTRPDEQDK